MSAWSGGGLVPGGLPVLGGSGPGGWGLVSTWSVGGSAWSGGVCLVRGEGLPDRGGSPCLETPPANRITDMCKNIALATTSLRPVITAIAFFSFHLLGHKSP